MATAQQMLDSFIGLDPAFWQALGKALGWRHMIDFEFQHDPSMGLPRYDHRAGQYPEWMYNAHRFYDLILTGGDTEKFWNDLLA